MAVSLAEVKRFPSIFKNFFGLSKSYPLAGKYHPGQILFHWVVAANLILLILTGFMICKHFRDLLPLSLFGLGWDFIFYNRLLHIHHPILPSTLSREGNQPKSTLFQKSHKKSLTIF
jgi:cytochrome b subunit of formate dehydrogenase